MVEAITQANLAQYTPREFVLLCGYGGTGKSSAIFSVARLLKRISPNAAVHAIDTENGLLKLWKTKNSDLDNIELYICKDIDDVILTFDDIVPKLGAQDWLANESMSRIWDYSQDSAYEQIVGLSKAVYLQKRLASGGKDAITPQPDRFWQIAKNAHNRRFLDPITMLDPLLNKNGCNMIMTTTLGAIKGEKQKESADRRIARMALGLTMDIEGAPRLAYHPDTVVHLTEESDGYWARILKDRGPSEEKPKFKIENNDFWLTFISNCR